LVDRRRDLGSYHHPAIPANDTTTTTISAPQSAAAAPRVPNRVSTLIHRRCLLPSLRSRIKYFPSF